MVQYAPAMNSSERSFTSNVNNPTRLLTADMVDYLNNSLSKLGISILKELYQSPQMQQKNLAASIHTSTTSLSNILSRLEDIQPQLLVSERAGRSKYYSLTEIASSYVAQVILPREKNKIHQFSTRLPKDSLISETLNSLYLFQDAAGQEWDLILDDMLVSSHVDSRGEMVSAGKDELFTFYEDFMEQMKQLKTLNLDTSIREIYEILNQPILIKRIESRLSRELTGFYALKPLFDLEKQNLRKTISLINDIFMEIAPEVFLPPNSMYSPPTNAILPDEQYNKIFREIYTMKNDFFRPGANANKELITKHWQSKYFWQGYSLMYIAEKCSELFRTINR